MSIILSKLDYLKDIIAISEEICKLSINIIKTNFFQDLHLNSIQIFEIFRKVELKYNIIIPDEIAENMSDLKDIGDYIYTNNLGLSS